MFNTIGLIAIGYIAAIVTVMYFKRPPATPDEAADEKIRAEIMAKLNRVIDDTRTTV